MGILAKAITNIEKNAYKASMTPEFRNVLNLVLDSLAFPTSLIGKALKPVAPILTPILAAIPESASLMKTTTAVTMTSGSPQSNVLPKVSTATINSRILPGMTMDEVEKHLNKVIGDKRVKVERIGGNDPSPVSPTNTETFRVIDELSKELWEKPVTAPYVIMGATDATARTSTGIRPLTSRCPSSCCSIRQTNASPSTALKRRWCSSNSTFGD